MVVAMQPRCKSPRPVPVAPVGTGIRPLLKVFTGRFGPGTGEVLFDRICRENGIKHLLTAPRSPTTTGKVERFHKTLRREFLTGEVFASIEEAQAALDAWVQHYNHDRPHQSIGMVAPFERFRLAAPEPVEATAAAAPDNDPAPAAPTAPAPAASTRRVGANGLISFAAAKYRAGGGWPARTSPWSATAAWCICSTGACSSPPTPAVTASTSRPPASAEPTSDRRPGGRRRRRPRG